MASTSTEDLPKWAGLTTSDVDKLSAHKRMKLISSYNDNKSKANRERLQLASCKNASFVQKLDPWYVTN